MSEKVELKVTGMNCGHCEAAVKKALMGLDGVIDAAADHQAQKAEVKVTENGPSREEMIQAIVKAGYEAQ